MSEQLLQTRAMFAPETINVEERTVELVWSTGAQVERSSWSRGDYIEELSMVPEAVRLDRLNAGAPFLDTHESFSLRSQIGVVLRAWLNGNEGRALVKFSRREDVESIFQDVRDGIYRNVSVAYKVHKTERDETGPVPVERAVDWEPYELSLVPIPADAGAQVRSDEPTPTQLQRERSMNKMNQGAPTVEAAPEENIQARAAAPEPVAPAIDVEAVRAEDPPFFSVSAPNIAQFSSPLGRNVPRAETEGRKVGKEAAEGAQHQADAGGEGGEVRTATSPQQHSEALTFFSSFLSTTSNDLTSHHASYPKLSPSFPTISKT